MNHRFTQICAAGLLALTTGCAGSYTAIQPNRIATYVSSPSASPIEMAYQFDALRQRGGNKKYVKKETKNGYHVAAVRVTNKSDREINFSRDVDLLYGDRPVVPTPSAVAAHDLRQGVAIYLLYLLLNPTVGATTDPRTGAVSGGTTIPLGPFVAGGNMLGASGANANLRKEFAAYDLTNRTIKSGETVYGIVSMRETSVAPIRAELRASAMPAAALPTPAATPAVVPAATPVAAPR
jgi:hypothetical protein